MKEGLKGGFMVMILSILGIVLFVTMFGTVMSSFVTLLGHASLSTFIAMETVVKIAPTVIFLAGVFGAGIGYYKGYKSVAEGGSDPGGLMRMVLGVLVVILFVTLFATILTEMATLHGSANAVDFIAFQTVVSISPTVLFLAGIFAGGATAYGGYSTRKKGKALKK